MSRTLETVPLGRTGLSVTELCIGTSALASMADTYGYEVSEDRAIATLQAVFDSPVRFLDTSNGYGEDGSAERRVGTAIRRSSGLPSGMVLATKVDPDPVTEDFSGDRVRASFEESLERLGLDRLALLHLHDPERIPFEDAVGKRGPVDALVALRNEGLVGTIGVAGGPVGLLQSYLDTGAFDVVLTHNRYTLLDRSAEELFRLAHEAGLGVLNAAPYGGGMLARGPAVQQTYAYEKRDPRIAEAARAMQAVCAEAGVPLAAAALQLSTRASFVHSTVVGVSAPERVAETVALDTLAIPDGLWDELERLTPPRDTWLDG